MTGSAAGATPAVTVVVALISGKTADLERCLTALDTQEDAPPLEILVPYDEACREVATLASRFPRARFIPLEGFDTRQARAGASREHHDVLRTLGLRRAAGDVVILTEDHAFADPRWCASLLEVLAREPTVACIGGAVEWGGRTLLSYAVFLCDFGRYQNPLPEGPAAFVSDSNVCYRRRVLDQLADAWRDQYREAVLHGAIAARGEQLWLTPRSVVWQGRSGLTWGEAIRERYVWGRSYAASRVQSGGIGRRAVYAGFSVALPFLLTWRLVSGARRRGRLDGRTVASIPLLFALSAVWSIGEGIGYVTGKAS
jgi:glycosyl transferase family 2